MTFLHTEMKGLGRSIQINTHSTRCWSVRFMFVSDILQMERSLYSERVYTVFLSLLKKVSFKVLFTEKVSFIKKNMDSHKSKTGWKDLKVIRQLLWRVLLKGKNALDWKAWLIYIFSELSSHIWTCFDSII